MTDGPGRDDRRRLTARTMRLSGDADAARAALAATRVLVVGAGGLGSPAIAVLAGSGLDRITIVDPDVVEVSNLSRQTLFTAADIGRDKARCAAERAAGVDPLLDVRAVTGRFTADLVEGHDVVLDAADSLDVTRAVSDACARAGIPWVWGSVLGFDGQTSVFWEREGIDFHDLHDGSTAGLDGSCEVDGVLPSLCQSIGSVMAAQVLALVAAIGEPLLGTVLTVDASSWEWTRSALRRGPGSRRPVTQDRISADALATLLEADVGGLAVVDVRTVDERVSGMIPGAVPPALLDPGATDVVVVCERGPRADSWVAANREHLSGRVRVLDGGMGAWRAAARVTAGHRGSRPVSPPDATP